MLQGSTLQCGGVRWGGCPTPLLLQQEARLLASSKASGGGASVLPPLRSVVLPMRATHMCRRHPTRSTAGVAGALAEATPPALSSHQSH